MHFLNPKIEDFEGSENQSMKKSKIFSAQNSKNLRDFRRFWEEENWAKEFLFLTVKALYR